MELTDEQRRAIEYLDGTQAVTACPGSGKSRVLQTKCLYLLEHGVKPEEIIVITYTRNAAASLRQRIESILAESGEKVAAFQGLLIDTIHGACLELMRKHLSGFRYRRVIDDVERDLLVMAHYDRLGIGNIRKVAGAHAGKPALGRVGDPRHLLAALDLLRGQRDGIMDERLVPEALWDICRRYEQLLGDKRTLDFTAILVTMRRALTDQADLTCRAFQQAIRDRVRHLLVDEYQDVDCLSHEIVSSLIELGVEAAVVGDPNQMIHGFRGVTGKEFAGFAAEHAATEFELTENHRSHERLVALQQVVATWPGLRPMAMKSAAQVPYPSGDIRVRECESKREEAQIIARRIKQLTAGGIPANEIAILFRKCVHEDHMVGPYLKALEDKHIRYQVRKIELLGAFEAEAACCAFEYLAGAHQWPKVEAAWRAAMPALTDLQLACTKRILDGYKAWDDGQGMPDLQRILGRLLSTLRVSRLTVGEEAMMSIGRISTAIKLYDSVRMNAPAAVLYHHFARWLRHTAPAAFRKMEFPQEQVEERVQIMTIHAAKSLEFRAVFVPALTNGLFPMLPGDQEERGLWTLIPRAAVRDARGFEDENEEERRVFFVAISRAQKHLYLTGSKASPSPFLTACKSLPMIGRGEPNGAVPRARPAQKPLLVRLTLTELGIFRQCPYQWWVRFRCLFCPPRTEEVNYGASISATNELVRQHAKRGRDAADLDIEQLVRDNLYLPNASEKAREGWIKVGVQAVNRQIERFWPEMQRTLDTEVVTTVRLPGIEIEARCDAIEITDNGGERIVEDKTTHDPDEAIQKANEKRFLDATALHALGRYQQTGVMPEEIAVRINSPRGYEVKERLITPRLQDAEGDIFRARDMILAGNLPTWQGEWDDPACPCTVRCEARNVCARWQGRADHGRRA